jgi:ABC-type bacteriocin/lantibiotic exporter with double-glycine peptidase domain
MLTQRVASPLVQLSHLLQQYDEARLAIKSISKLVQRFQNINMLGLIPSF